MKRFKYLTLAALVGLWACDSGNGTTTEPTITGTISGHVTIEGTGASGVTVTLSSGTTATTDASGLYTFSTVNAGAYTVTISGYPSDATFDATAKAATITTSGQVVSVDFAGSYIKTSSIVGVVSAGTGGLAGVTVALSGAASSSTTTDASGAYSFSGLRAGSYTVTISGFGSQYTFPATSQNATLGVGESQVVSFSGAYVTTAVVSGLMYLDENAKDNTYTAGLEDALTVANVTVTLELSVGNDITTQTAADGTYSFGNLPPGTYRVSIDATSSAIPAAVAFGGTSPQVVTVTAGGQATVNWPFDIVKETVKAYGFLGVDAVNPGITPVEGWAMSLYPTEADATASTNPLASGVKTDAGGAATFTFDRADDTNPNGGASDQIVFAKYGPLPAGPYTANGETVIEISYNAKDSLASAPDTFDALYTQVVVQAHAEEIDGDSLPGWGGVLLDAQDSTGTVMFAATDAHGDAYYTVTPGTGDSDGSLPDTLWFRLGFAQPLANGHAFDMTPSGDRGMAAGQYVSYVWDGTVVPSDTVMLGSEAVKYLDADLSFVVHHEEDDTAGLTAGDDFTNANAIDVDLDTLNTDGTVTVLATSPSNTTDGMVTFTNQSTAYSYVVRSRSHNASAFVLQDTTMDLSVDGSDQVVMNDDAFGFKTNNNTVNGTVLNSDGAGVKDVIVTVEPTADNIEGSAAMVDTTDAGGAYSFTGMVEGPYTVSVADITGAWAFFDTLDAPAAGTDDNTDAHSGMRDVQGWGDIQTANFAPDRMDGEVAGQVVNDRDGDNTLDPTDALAGAVINLYDADGNMVTSATTDASGDYSFTGLREGDYMVQWSADTPDASQQVLRALNTDSAFVTVTATNDVPVAASASLPSWNYSTTMAANADEADFVYLAKNTVAKGMVWDGTDPIAGMTISLRRCDQSAGAVKPPAAGTCTTYLGTTITTVSDASGNFEFDNLVEGVYQISPQPGTVGSYTTSTPASALYLQQNPADVETFTFLIG